MNLTDRMTQRGIATIVGLYRYDLRYTWDSSKGYALFVCLNPSTANSKTSDPTARRCIAFARAWDMGGVRIANLFAYRAREPRRLLRARDPVGPRNDEFLLAAAAEANVVVAAWGNGGTTLGRDAIVRKLLPRLHNLRLTASGNPAHPLYLPKHLTPVPWK
jgi:hypothetical protein